MNPHEPCGPTDFKSGASADSATQAKLKTNYLPETATFFNSTNGDTCGDFISALNDGSSAIACNLYFTARWQYLMLMDGVL